MKNSPPATSSRKCLAEVGSQAIDRFGTPSLASLALQNFAADVMIKSHQFLVGGKGCTLLCRGDLGFQPGQPRA